MTLRELIEQLEDLAEEHGPHVEVRIAHQPSWPLEYTIREAVAVHFDADEDEPVAEDYPGQYVDWPSSEPVVYLAEERQLGYLPGVASRELGWRE